MSTFSKNLRNRIGTCDCACQDEEIGKAANRIEKLEAALQAASDHLDYCGYGDSWERECAEGLEEQIEAALK